MKISNILIISVLFLQNISLPLWAMEEGEADICSGTLTQRLGELQREFKTSQLILTAESEGESLQDVEMAKKHLALMFSLDQCIRSLYTDFPSADELYDEYTKIEKLCTGHLKKILLFHSPLITISKFGEEACRHAWSIVQHSPLELQSTYLSAMESVLPPQDIRLCAYAKARQAVNTTAFDFEESSGPDIEKVYSSTLKTTFPSLEIFPQLYAPLYDRVALRMEKKQRYGTQSIFLEGNKIGIEPCQGSPEEVNELRKEMGLRPLQDYLEMLRKAYKKE